jgi:hypothetical protein
MSLRPLVFNVQAAGLPAYLRPGGTTVAPWQWMPVASQTNEQMGTVAPTPRPASTLSSTGHPFTGWDAWTGAVVDQSRKEMIFPARGGHGDSADNSTYATNLAHDAPKIYRLTSPSTEAAFQASRNRPQPTAPNPDLYTDGFSPAMHHCNELQYQDGRIWWIAQTSTSGEGTTATSTSGFNGNWIIPACISLDRDAMGSGPIAVGDSRYPLSNAASNLWRKHGRTSQFWVNQLGGFGCSAAMPTAHKVFGFKEFTGQNEFITINTTPGATETTRATYGAAGVPLGVSAWAVGCDDLGIVVVGRYGTATINVLAGVTASTAGTWHSVSVPNSYLWNEYDPTSAGTFRDGYNPVYHAASRSIFLYEFNQNTSGKIRRLKIPTSGGAYQQGGTWQWSEIQTANFVTQQMGQQVGGQNTYGRFNIINDIGGGNAVLVHSPRTNASVAGPALPIYVCRIDGSLT